MNDMVDASIIDVIDGCRLTTRNFDRDEFIFLSNRFEFLLSFLLYLILDY